MMRIVTWNVLNTNPHSDKIVQFAIESSADVIAFQELTSEHIEALRQIPEASLHIARDFRENGDMSFLGLLSRLPVKATKTIEIPRKHQFSPSMIGRRMKWEECFDAQSITVEHRGSPITIVNVHLTNAAPPSIRRCEINYIYEQTRDSGSLIFCGDFNTFSSPLLNLFIGWQYGFQMADYFVGEIKLLKLWAKERGLHLIDCDRATYAGFRYLRLRLDHFLVSIGECCKARVLNKTLASDHYPVVLEFLQSDNCDGRSGV